MQGPQFQMTERRAERPPGQHRAVASKPDKEGTSIRSEDTVPGNKVSTTPLAPESRCGRWVHASTRAGCATWPVKIDEPGQDWTGSSSCDATPAAIRERSDASSKAPHRGVAGHRGLAPTLMLDSTWALRCSQGPKRSSCPVSPVATLQVAHPALRLPRGSSWVRCAWTERRGAPPCRFEPPPTGLRECLGDLEA
jgi:hypothetical protein